MPETVEDNVACRICMDPKDNYVSLFSHDLSKKVKEVADVQVEKDDGLPDSICTECEQDLEKCYEFRIKVQVSDKKFRSNLKFSQVQIEECNIKEERFVDNGNSDNMDDKDSVSMDDDHYDEPDVSHKSTEDVEEADPLNHVVVVEEKEGKMEVPGELLSQDNAMNVEPQVEKIEEVALDPLVCMKEEAEIMDVDSNQRDPFGASSSGNGFGHQPIAALPNEGVFGSEKLQPTLMVSSGEALQTSLPLEANRAVGVSEHLKQPRYLLCRQGAPNSTFRPVFALATSSNTPMGIILPGNLIPNTMVYTRASTPVTALMAGDPKFYQNMKPKVKSISKKYVQDASRNVSFTNVVKNTQSSTSSVESNDSVITEKSSLDLQSKATGQAGKTNENLVNKDEHSGDPSINDKQENSDSSSVKRTKSKSESFCWVCNVSCGSIELLREHKERKGFICRTCTSSFADHTELETHFISHTPFKCKNCGETFYFRKDLFRHRLSDKCIEVLNYSCEHCGKKFLRSTQLRQHVWTHKEVEEESSKMCVVCKKRFRNSQFLTAHERSTHLVYEYVECGTCQKLLLGPMKLRAHIQTVHIERMEDERYPCTMCEKICTNNSALKAHIMEKHDVTEFVCEVCGQSIKGRKAMQVHKKYKHTQEPYRCTWCNQQFDTRTTLKKHRKTHVDTSTQTVTKAFCEICGKAFKTKQILRNHLTIHSDEKPFKCEVCGAAFKQKTTLRTHGRVHNSVGKYSCFECGLTFKWKQTFDKHVNSCESNNAGESDSESD